MEDKSGENKSPKLVKLTADIVSAYVSNNILPVQDVPSLISEVHGSLSKAMSNLGDIVEKEVVPAVSIGKSIKQDYIICLEDGKKFKSLKRHLRTQYNLTPEAYREKWNLPNDYPMVAPNYAKTRSSLAKEMGLGQKGRTR